MALECGSIILQVPTLLREWLPSEPQGHILHWPGPADSGTRADTAAGLGAGGVPRVVGRTQYIGGSGPVYRMPEASRGLAQSGIMDPDP